MQIEYEEKYDFNDVLIKPKRSKNPSRSTVSLSREFSKFLYFNKKFECTPIIAANMDTIGTIEMWQKLSNHKWMTALHKFYNLDQILDHSLYDLDSLAFFTIGISTEKLECYIDEFKVPPTFLCIDVANGYTETFAKHVSSIRKLCGNSTFIMTGNVCTPEMTQELLLAGADCIKIGIGGGSACLTREVTGVGYPQLSAIIECADAAHGLGGYVCSDGGCRVVGDVTKAFGAGADFVMLGGMLSGHDECAGRIIKIKQKKYKEFYGMSSDVAMKKHYGGVANYRTSEGRRVIVPYKGPVENTVNQIEGGLRSAMTYIGAHKLKDIPKCTTFVRVRRQLNEIYKGYEI